MTAGVPGGKTFGLNRKRVKIPHETVTVIAVGMPPQADSALLQPIFSLHHTKISYLLTQHRDTPTGRLGVPSADIFSASHENITPADRTPGCPHRQTRRSFSRYFLCVTRKYHTCCPDTGMPPQAEPQAHSGTHRYVPDSERGSRNADATGSPGKACSLSLASVGIPAPYL